jgi:hypothetical protein
VLIPDIPAKDMNFWFVLLFLVKLVLIVLLIFDPDFRGVLHPPVSVRDAFLECL